MSRWKDVHKGAAADAGGVMAMLALPIFADCRTLGECLLGGDPQAGVSTPPCKVTIFGECGQLKLAVNDPTTSRVGFVTLDPRLGLGDALEHALTGGGLEWRKAKAAAGGAWQGPRK